MTVQAQELQRQIREGERAERDDRDRRAKERQEAESRRKWLDNRRAWYNAFCAAARIRPTSSAHCSTHRDTLEPRTKVGRTSYG
jgi:hypothetical protein